MTSKIAGSVTSFKACAIPSPAPAYILAHLYNSSWCALSGALWFLESAIGPAVCSYYSHPPNEDFVPESVRKFHIAVKDCILPELMSAYEQLIITSGAADDSQEILAFDGVDLGFAAQTVRAG